MTNQKSAIPTEPWAGLFDEPSSLVGVQILVILEVSLNRTKDIGDDQIDTAQLKLLVQRIGVVGTVSRYAPALLPRPEKRRLKLPRLVARSATGVPFLLMQQTPQTAAVRRSPV
jgi:hypothetical protein